ncbi:hypothetical protein Vretimale_16174, partial [Volvox reticuliferus]
LASSARGSSAGADGGASGAGPSGGGGGGAAPRMEPNLHLLEGHCRTRWGSPQDATQPESVWSQAPPDHALWEATLSPQLREQNARILDQLQKVMRGEPLTAAELQEIHDRAARDADDLEIGPGSATIASESAAAGLSPLTSTASPASREGSRGKPEGE